MRILVLIMFFFIVGALFIISNNNLAMYDQDNVVTFVDLYLTWLGDITDNFKSITGNVVELRWVPEEF
jgi:hypothetical protein